jgi:hypothetical protein
METDLSRVHVPTSRNALTVSQAEAAIDLAALFSPLLPFDNTGALANVHHEFTSHSLPTDSCPIATCTAEDQSKQIPDLVSGILFYSS